METDPASVESTSDACEDQTTDEETELVEVELLVEEISIDGMCGVY